MSNSSLPEPQSEPSGLLPEGSEGIQENASLPAPQMPTSQPILLRAMRWGILASVLLVALFAWIGWMVSGMTGLIGGALGATFAGVFLVLTAGSIAFANRFIASESYLVVFFAIVMGAWLLKFVAFIVAALLLKDQVWLNPTMLFLGVISGVLVSLVIDAIVLTRARIPAVNLPE